MRKKFFLIPVALMILVAVAVGALIFASIFGDFKNAETSEEKERIELFCALASCIAYDKPKNNSLREILQTVHWGIYNLPSENDGIKIKAFIVKPPSENFYLPFKRNPDVEFLAITGTEDLDDLIVDMQLKMVPFEKNPAEDILVHEGFLNYTDALLSDNVLKYLVRAQNEDPKKIFYLTGHSLGGAVAVLTAARLEKLKFDMSRIKVVTFGAPAAGNSGFVEKYKDKINLTRIVMTGDPVPISFDLFGYVHFGDVIQYTEKRIPGNTFHEMLTYVKGAAHGYDETENFDDVIYEKILDDVIFSEN